MGEQTLIELEEEPADDLAYGEWDQSPPPDSEPHMIAQPEFTPPDPADELVHWMDAPPVRAGVAAITVTAAGAFVLGAGVAVGVLALMHWLGPERELVVVQPRRRV